MAKDREDYMGKMGDIYPKTAPEWPMYSYSRPASIFWDAVANAMHDAGESEAQIKEWLQSKNPRWMLDGTWGDKLEELGYALGLTLCGDEKTVPDPWTSEGLDVIDANGLLVCSCGSAEAAAIMVADRAEHRALWLASRAVSK